MPIEISVGAPVLTINQGSTFMVTDPSGQMKAEGELGVFAEDTRFVSYYEISADGSPWLPLTSSPITYYAARIHLTNPKLVTDDGPIPEGTLALVITRTVGDGVHEDIDISNHGLSPVCFNLEIALRSDFADIFEVKSHDFVRRGHIVTEWSPEGLELRTSYTHDDFRRRFAYRVLNNGSAPAYANGRITFPIDLAPGANWHSCGFYILVHGARIRASRSAPATTPRKLIWTRFRRSGSAVRPRCLLATKRCTGFTDNRSRTQGRSGCTSMISLVTCGYRPAAFHGLSPSSAGTA